MPIDSKIRGIALAILLACFGLGLALLNTEEKTPDGMIPVVEGAVPPAGWIEVQTPDGRSFWADPRANTLSPSPPQSELTEEQIGRIKAFKQILGQLDPTTLEQALDNFSRDAQPENEIVIWEQITGVWQAEVTARGDADPNEASRVYLAVLGCSLVGPDAERLLAWKPELKGLPDLDRLVQRYRGELDSKRSE